MDKQELERYSNIGSDLINKPNFEDVLLKLEQNLGNTNGQIREDCLDLLWDLIELNVIPENILLKNW